MHNTTLKTSIKAEVERISRLFRESKLASEKELFGYVRHIDVIPAKKHTNIGIILSGEAVTPTLEDCYKELFNDSNAEPRLIRPFFFCFKAELDLYDFLRLFRLPDSYEVYFGSKGIIDNGGEVSLCLISDASGIEEAIRDAINRTGIGLTIKPAIGETNSENSDKLSGNLVSSRMYFSFSASPKQLSDEMVKLSLRANLPTFPSLSFAFSKNMRRMRSSFLNSLPGIKSLECHYVGQGNFSYLVDNRGAAFAVIDPGDSIFGAPLFPKTSLAAQGGKIKVVFLTHFDLDHFAAAIEAPHNKNTDLFRKRWIVPDLSSTALKPSFCVGLLLPYLCKRSEGILRIKPASHPTPVPTKTIPSEKTRYMVWANKAGGTTNDSGFMLAVSGPKKWALFPGDSMNIGSVSNLPNTFDFMYVPHHGAKMMSNCQFLNKVGSNTTAVFSFGLNSYGHPSPVTIQSFLAKDCQIEFMISHRQTPFCFRL